FKVRKLTSHAAPFWIGAATRALRVDDRNEQRAVFSFKEKRRLPLLTLIVRVAPVRRRSQFHPGAFEFKDPFVEANVIGSKEAQMGQGFATDLDVQLTVDMLVAFRQPMEGQSL